MSAPAPDAAGGPPSPAFLEARRLRRRRIATLAMVPFLAFGFWFFSGRVPKDVTLRFEVPATLRGPSGDFPRTRLASVGGSLTKEGERVASVSLPTPSGLDGPLSPPVGLQLRKGTYGAHLVARSIEGHEVDLDGVFEVDGSGEVRVDLRARR